MRIKIWKQHVNTVVLPKRVLWFHFIRKAQNQTVEGEGTEVHEAL